MTRAVARDAHRQTAYSVRLEWGLAGASSIGADCEIAVVIDVLSFTTTLTVAADRGITVFPYPWRDERAARFASDHLPPRLVPSIAAAKMAATERELACRI
jgi:2-phosphosulfolactate phosphatase